MQSACWRPGRASGALQSESKTLRTGAADCANPDEMRCPSSTVRQAERGEFLLPLPFVLFRPRGLDDAYTLLGGQSTESLI